MPYVKMETRSGKLLEVEWYFTSRYGKKGIGRSANAEETGEDMERVNQRRAEKKLHRLTCANFSRENGDLFVTLTTSADMDEAAAMRSERNVLARIKRLRERKGLAKLKYIAVTEKQGKWHHHLILNGGITFEEIRELWNGRVTLSALDDSDTCEELAKYLTKGHKPKKGEKEAESAKEPRRKWARRWHASRNLKKPVEKVTVMKKPPKAGEPRARKGFRLLANWRFGCDRMGYLYSYAAFMRMDDAAGARGRAAAARPRGSGAAAPAGWRAEPSEDN